MTGGELKEIENLVKKKLSGSTDPLHSYGHVDRVRKLALVIVKRLKVRKIDSYLLQAACLLHDVPVSMFNHGPAVKHFFEPIAVRRYLPEILSKLNISQEDKNILINAVVHHSFTIPYMRLNRKGDMYLKIMQDADSLDFLSREREVSFKENRKKFFSYYLISPIASKYLSYARKNIGRYLNYPQLSQYDWFK